MKTMSMFMIIIIAFVLGEHFKVWMDHKQGPKAHRVDYSI